MVDIDLIKLNILIFRFGGKFIKEWFNVHAWSTPISVKINNASWTALCTTYKHAYILYWDNIGFLFRFNHLAALASINIRIR